MDILLIARLFGAYIVIALAIAGLAGVVLVLTNLVEAGLRRLVARWRKTRPGYVDLYDVDYEDTGGAR